MRYETAKPESQRTAGTKTPGEGGAAAAGRTRIKLSLCYCGHGRYVTVTPERTLFSCVRWGIMAVTYSRYKFLTAPLPKRFRNGRFASETDVRRFQK